VHGEWVILQPYQQISYCRFRKQILTSVNMKDVIHPHLHLLTTIAKVIRPGGSRNVITENLLLTQELIIHGRSRERAPNLIAGDRALSGLWSLFS